MYIFLFIFFFSSRRRHTRLDPGREGAHDDMSSHARMHHGSSDRPMFATITIAVCHCGAGCLLGDVVGEWLVYGAGISIIDEVCGRVSN